MAIADDIGKAETLGIIAVVIVAGYYLYKAGGAFASWVDGIITDIGGGTKPSQSYTQALGSTISHPVDTISSIAGLSQGGSSNSNWSPSFIIPNGGGLTAGDLQASGWSDDQINELVNSNLNSNVTTVNPA